jgi:hypothetical protein
VPAPDHDGQSDDWWTDDRWDGWDGSWAGDWAPEPEPEVDDAGPAEADRERTPLLEEFLRLVDRTSDLILDHPIRPRVKVSAGGLARAEVDEVRLELPAVLAAGLVLDRVAVRAERVRVAPGLPPHLRAGPVDLTATVTQDKVDRWTTAGHLPIRLLLTDEGIAVNAGVAGFRVGRVLTELDVSRRFLRLRPRRASVIGLPAPLVRFLRGYLPLPPLPRGAHLVEVTHHDGELAARFRIDEFDEPMTPDVARRVAGMLRLHIPGF